MCIVCLSVRFFEQKLKALGWYVPEEKLVHQSVTISLESKTTIKRKLTLGENTPTSI